MLHYSSKDKMHEIEMKYNPDHDIGSDPVQVDWVKYYLLDIIRDQQFQIEELEAKVKEIDGRLLANLPT